MRETFGLDNVTRPQRAPMSHTRLILNTRRRRDRLATLTQKLAKFGITAILAAFGCTDATTPSNHVADERPEDNTGFAAVTAIMASPFDETTIRRLNIALGRAADAPMRMKIVESVRFDGVRNAQGPTVPTVVAANGGPDPACSFESGGTYEEYQACVSCADSAGDDCHEEIVLEHEIDSNGAFTTHISALHIGPAPFSRTIDSWG